MERKSPGEHLKKKGKSQIPPLPDPDGDSGAATKGNDGGPAASRRRKSGGGTGSVAKDTGAFAAASSATIATALLCAMCGVSSLVARWANSIKLASGTRVPHGDGCYACKQLKEGCCTQLENCLFGGVPAKVRK